MFIKLVIRHVVILLIGTFLLSFPTKITAQLSYTFERLNTENGLPASTIKGIEFDEKNRFLWVATESGIVRYNGHSIQNFGDLAITSKLNGRIASIDRKVDGTIFGRLLDESVFHINSNIAKINPEHLVLNYYDEYLNYKYNLNNNRKFLVNRNIGITYNDFFINNSLYVLIDQSSENKLCEYKNNKYIQVAILRNNEQGFVIKNRMFFLRNDGSVIEIYKLKNDSVAINKIKIRNNYNFNKNINKLKLKVFRDSNGDVNLLNSNKLYSVHLIDNQISFELITDMIPKTEDIRFLKIDKLTNTIYLGTDNRGLLIGHPSYFKRIMQNDYQNGNSSAAYAQFLLPNGNIQTNSGQIFGSSKKTTQLIFYKPSYSNTYTSPEGVFYFTNSDGIVEYDLKKSKLVNRDSSTYANRNSFIEINKIIYSFSDNGISIKQDARKWIKILNFKTIPIGFIVHQLQIINSNVILAATTDGLYKYTISENKFIRIFRDKSGANFRTIYDIGGYYLLGTYGGGVYVLKGDSIKALPMDQSKYLSYTHCFIEDDQHRIWSSTNKGLFMSPKKSLIDFWDKGPGNITFKYFGKIDGIDVLEMNGGCTPCVIKLNNGDFSFPGIDGLIQFNPYNIPDIKITPKIFLDKVIIDNKVFYKEKLNQNFPFKSKSIELQFGISGMLSQENVMFEYKIDSGLWNRVGVKNSNILLGNPSFGSHIVTTRIRNTYEKNWISQDYTIYVNYPWFLNPYMYIVYFFSIIGLIFLYIHFKTIIYKKRQLLLEKEISSKTASLNKINDYLIRRNQAKDQVIAIMNHDILTPLKYLHITAKNVAESTQDEKIKNSMQQIAKTTKELEYLTSNMLNWVKFDNIRALPPKQTIDLFDLVNDLLQFVKPFIQNVDVEIINQVKEGTSIDSWPDTLRVLLYNIIINAIKSTNKGSITIDFTSIHNENIISIQDTGIGMNDSIVKYLLTGNSEDGIENLPKYKKGNGVGYQIIRNIVKLMHGRINIDSVEGHGTNVLIYLSN